VVGRASRAPQTETSASNLLSVGAARPAVDPPKV